MLPAHSNQVDHSDAAECSSIISAPVVDTKSARKKKQKAQKIKASSTASLSSIDAATINFSFSSRKSSYTSNSRSQKLFAVPIPIKIVAPSKDRDRKLSVHSYRTGIDGRSDDSDYDHDHGECENEFIDTADPSSNKFKTAAGKSKTSAASDHSTNDSGIVVLEESDVDRTGVKSGKSHHQDRKSVV